MVAQDLVRKCSREVGINDNQEDSLVFNKTSVQRGKFRATSVKKHIMQVQKNQSTAQDDILTKPDPTKVSGIKHGFYDKLNDKGYVEKETMVEYGDVIFGKITPVSDALGSGKPFRDTSEIYKVGAPGVIDEVYLDTSTQDGYEVRKCRIRSERIPEIGDKYCCYDEETEILTESGWKYFKELTLKDKVATLVDGTTLEYRDITHTYEYDIEDEIYQVQSNQVDLLVTKNHRMYIKNKGSQNYTIKTAEEILNKRVHYKKNVENYNVLTTSEFIKGDKFVLPACDDMPEKEIDLDAWLSFFGIWMAEGSMASANQVQIAAHKQRVKDNLRISVPLMGYKLCENKSDENDAGENEYNNFRIYDKQLSHYMKEHNVGAINKTLPNWVWSLSTEKCRILLEGMILGDGHYMKDTTTLRYDTSSIKLAGDFQRLCLHSGYASNMALKYEAGKEATIVKGSCKGKKIKSTVDAYRLSVVKTQVEPMVNKNKSEEDKIADKLFKFKGKVYCCSVKEDKKNKTDGLVYVRRNGLTVWCGNSLHGQKGTIGIIMDDIDMPFNKHGLKPDIIVNPCAIPSRMTIGQLAECLVGKTAILQGMDADGTPFEDPDFTTVEDMLEKLGYERKGKEYLYNGMTGEKMLVEYFFGPTYYQRLKHLVRDKIHCLTMDHEVLTENGWKFFNDIKEGEKVACLENNKLVYQVPNKLLYFPKYKGKMYKVETQLVNLNVTANHRMWVSSLGSKKYRFELAENIVGKCVKYKKDAEWDAPDYQFVLPKVVCENGKVYEEKVVDMDQWLMFFGIWMAEGFASVNTETKQYRIDICIIKQRVKDTLLPALDIMGYEYSITEIEELVFNNKQLCLYLKQFSHGAPHKYLPEWVWNLSKRQAKLLLDALIIGDGSYNGNSIRYYTSSIKLANDVTRLALHAGCSGTVNLKEKAGSSTVIRGKTVTKNYDYWCVGINQSKNTPPVNKKYANKETTQNIEEFYDYEGPVFCLEVPSEVFYVRRNGNPIWTGNSRSRGLKTSLVRQAPEGRARDGGLRVGTMERDALIAHGLSKLLKEKLLDNSDAYMVYVCDKCGLFAQRFERPENKPYPREDDTYYCPACQNFNDISKVRIPYAFKLFIHELMSLNIVSRIRCKKDAYE